MPRPTLKPVAADMTAKVQCLWKPAQSGKTRAMQDMIRADDGYNKHLNIVICSKNRLLAAQTARRMEDDRAAAEADAMSVDTDNLDGDDAITDGVYCWMSGTKKTNIPVEALAWKIWTGEVSMVVCCAHKARFQYLHDLLGKLEVAKFQKPVNVWLDEADAYVKLWADDFDFAPLNCVREIHPVSATFGKIVERFGRIRVKPLFKTHLDIYRGLKDCKIVVEENCADISDVLAKYPKLTKPGVKLFAPASVSRKSHDDTADILSGMGFAVLVLNGVRKEFVLPDRTTHPIVLTVGGPELSQVLAEKYAELGLKHFPFAVTGRLCLDRGITFQSPKFVFTAGILPDIASPDEAYQCIARVLGNIGDFCKKLPTLYMSQKMKDTTAKSERVAINIARHVYDNGYADVGADEIERAAFDTEEEYQAREKPKPKVRFPDDEFDWEWSKVFRSHARAVKAGWGMKKNKKGTEYYSGLQADPETGFFSNRLPGKRGSPMTREQYEKLHEQSKTFCCAPPHGKEDYEVDGPRAQANFVFYEDPDDPKTARFVFKQVWRIHPSGYAARIRGPAAAGGGSPA